MRPADTSAEAERVQRRIRQQWSAEQRLSFAVTLCDDARVTREQLERVYGEELVALAYGPPGAT